MLSNSEKAEEKGRDLVCVQVLVPFILLPSGPGIHTGYGLAITGSRELKAEGLRRPRKIHIGKFVQLGEFCTCGALGRY